MRSGLKVIDLDNESYLALMDNKGNLKQSIQFDEVTAQLSRDDVTEMIEECAEKNHVLMVRDNPHQNIDLKKNG